MVNSYAQTEENTNTWDNQLYVGNKIAAGKNNWRYSGELQLRLKDNTQSLDNYFLEGVAFVIDKRHVLNFNYLFAASNTGQVWNWSGIPVIQLVININKEYNYLPAKYFNF